MKPHNQLPRLHPPVRRTYTQPTIAAILKPWTDRDPGNNRHFFLALQLEFGTWEYDDVSPTISGGRGVLLKYLADMSAFALPRQEIEAGDRLGSAVLRETSGDGEDFRYQLLIEVPDGLNRRSFYDFAKDEWFTHAGAPCVSMFPRVLGTVEDWMEVLHARAREAYIDSKEPLAWHLPRGWGAGRLHPRQMMGANLQMAA